MAVAVGFDTARQEPRHASAARLKKAFRPDIQGLRAFAVLVVVLDHLFEWPAGGFIGVDVFFVVSGFLITGLLLREYERTGRISLVDFYRRRIKRIMPAAVLVLIVTVVAAYFVFGQGRFLSTVVDAIWALLFAANWRFAASGTDYFQAGGPVSPLQHYWSLGVEEQFYFVWPWLLLLVFVLFLRGRWVGSSGRARIAAGAAITVIAVASFTCAMWQTEQSPTLAYFSTFTRGWELGVGAALAVIAPWFTRLSARVRPVVAWIGLAAMTASLFLIRDASPFPAPAAALPVLGTALVIAAGCGAPKYAALGVLTNPLSQYLGNISYSMYLWHWPIIVFGGVLLPEKGPLGSAALIGAIVLASVYSFHLVEDPIRRSDWMSGRPRLGRRSKPALRASLSWTWASFLAIIVVVTVTLQIVPRPLAVPDRTARGISASAPVVEGADPITTLQQEISMALAAEEWPDDLDPTIDEAINAGDTSEEILQCGLIVRYEESKCTFGDPAAEHTAVLVGDSTSMAYVEAIRTALGDDDGWQVKSYGTFGCSFMEPLIWNEDPEVVENCTDRKDAAIDAINELQPDLVFITNTYDPRVPAGEADALGPAGWKKAMAEIVARLQGSAGKTVFLAPPPNDVHIALCYSKVSKPADCISHVTDQWATFARADSEVAADLGAWYVNSVDWFCVDGLCPAFVGRIPTKSDHVHMLPAYAAKIAPVILQELIEQGILEPMS
jgi:peptidoglycan/LPS O-acetylase OafA/YrhL